MECLLYFINDIPFFMMVFFRVGGMLLFAPVFGNANIPLQIRVAISLMFTFILYPTVIKSSSTFPSDIISYTIIVIKEVAIGAVIGFAASIIFAAFTTAGYLISNQMGLDTAAIVDPSSETGEEEQSISIFYNMIALLIFLTINGHHWFIKTTVQSFEKIPLGNFQYTAVTLTKILTIFKTFLVMGIKISAPSLVVLLLTVVVLGLMAKVAQEINVFIIAFPIKILIGFLILLVSLPLVINAMKSYLIPLENGMTSLLSVMRG
ncbi:MAG: flagellar biosynthetic protein FliR [Candidatus Brocadia sp. WS118]|nr:MAG: flagellar biosynthetic protein FliR [Candidatus Brocadia sp. WS118]